MDDKARAKKYENLMTRGLKAEAKFTRAMDWVFNAIGAGIGGWLFWMIAGAIEVSLFQHLFWTVIGAAIGVIAIRVFFFFGQFFG